MSLWLNCIWLPFKLGKNEVGVWFNPCRRQKIFLQCTKAFAISCCTVCAQNRPTFLSAYNRKEKRVSPNISCSYPECRWFESDRRYHQEKPWNQKISGLFTYYFAQACGIMPSPQFRTVFWASTDLIPNPLRRGGMRCPAAPRWPLRRMEEATGQQPC